MGWSMFDICCDCSEPDPCANGLGYSLQFAEDFATDPPTYVTPVQVQLTTPATYDDSGGNVELQIQGASYVPPAGRPKIEYNLEGPDCNIGTGSPYVSTITMEIEFLADSTGAEERGCSVVLKKNEPLFVTQIAAGYDIETGTMTVSGQISSFAFSDSTAFTLISEGRLEATFTNVTTGYELTVKLYDSTNTEIDSWDWNGDGGNALFPLDKVSGCDFYFFANGIIRFVSVDPGSRDYTLTLDNFIVDWT